MWSITAAASGPCVPVRFTLHVILDNSATYKHKTVRKWLAACARFKLTSLDRVLVAQSRRKLVQRADTATPSPQRLEDLAGPCVGR